MEPTTQQHPTTDTIAATSGASDSGASDSVAHTLARRAALRDRHARALTQLMTSRSDLRGVNDLADFVDDAVRWTA